MLNGEFRGRKRRALYVKAALLIEGDRLSVIKPTEIKRIVVLDFFRVTFA